MTKEEYKKEILTIRNGTIGLCKTEGMKYYYLYKEIVNNTQFLPQDIEFKIRLSCYLNDITEMKKCECGCNEYLKDPMKRFICGHSNKSKDVKDKKIKAAMDKYGVSNVSQAHEIKEKKKDTYIEHYGVDHFMKSEGAVQRVSDTVMKRYGVSNIFQDANVKKEIMVKWQNNKPNILQKRKETQINNFYKSLIHSNRLKDKFIPLFDINEYKGVKDIKYDFKCIKCGNIVHGSIDDGHIPRCLICNPLIDSGGQSLIEKELIDFIRKYENNIKIQNRSVLKNFELDVYLPDKNIAFELDGLYWHSELNQSKRGLSKYYHLNKTKLCEENNIQLIHIFEDEWLYNNKIVKNKIKHLLKLHKYKIGARECEIKEIDNNIKSKFLNKYHLQGNDSSSINLGAFYRNRLVAVMTYGIPRFVYNNITKDDYEMYRFCTIGSFSIMGIADKLLKYFEMKYNPMSIISYADRRWSNGNLYKKLGFVLENISDPGYFYMKEYKRRLNRLDYQKGKLEGKVAIFDDYLSEWAIMQLNGYDRIWDCGQYVFKINYENKENSNA